MKQTLLDTSFILSCINEKLDFFEELFLMGIQIIIPNLVIQEIKKIIKSEKKMKTKNNAKLALKIIQKNKFKKITLEKKHTDNALVEFLNKNKKIILATTDKELKKRVTNEILVIRGKKKLKIL